MKYEGKSACIGVFECLYVMGFFLYGLFEFVPLHWHSPAHVQIPSPASSIIHKEDLC